MDDVDALPLSYAEESYLFFVDSGQRNKLAYPTSNNYTITFDPPFTNVIGLDLLDATVPRTEYLLDHNTNYFVFRVEGQDWITLSLSPGDYDINQLMSFLTQAVDLYDNGATFVVTGSTDILTIENRLKFVCSKPFEINMSATTMRTVLGFSDGINASLAVNNYALSSAYTPGGPEYFASIPDTGNIVTAAAFAGPPPVLDSAPLTAPASQTFTCAGSGAFLGMTLFCTTIGSPSPGGLSATVTTASGNALVATASFELAPGALAPAAAVSAVGVAPLAQGVQYTVTLNATGVDRGNCYAISYTSPTVPRTDVPPNSFTSGNTVYSSAVMCCTVTQGITSHVLIAPGIFNLTGQRYVTLHCPQVESHLYRGRTYDPFSYGLARIPLTGFGIGEAAFDFASVPKRRFSPLARLAELTFHFVRPDGTDYDFKGVDHTLTLVAHYYVPPVNRPPASLFRNYEPDPLKFRVDQLRKQEETENERRRRMYNRGLEWTNEHGGAAVVTALDTPTWAQAWRDVGSNVGSR